jgi:hypothetical protein
MIVTAVGTKLPVMLLFVVIAIVIGLTVPLASPDQLRNPLPASGTAVKVTERLEGYKVRMGLRVTLPLPLMFSLSVYLTGALVATFATPVF